MLKFFQLESTFYQVTVRLYVDCAMREASLSVTHARRLIRASESVPFHEVATVAAAESWMRRPMGERGNFIETLEWQCRSGILKAAA